MRVPNPLKEHARHPEPQSGSALTAPAATNGAAGATRRYSLAGWLICIPAFGVLASLAGNNPAAAPRHAALLATDTRLDHAPPRKAAGLELIRNGWVYNCMECHTLLTAKWRFAHALNEHRDVNLDHGNNRYCLNCHHPTNRNAFADYDGAEIAKDDIVQVCAKCHGTIFRDWQAGIHGRQNGYWHAPAGTKTKLTCIQCHDPHQPKFPAMKPLAPLRYPPRAAGSTVSSFGSRVSGSIADSSEPTKSKAKFRAAFNPKPETRNAKPTAACSATAVV